MQDAYKPYTEWFFLQNNSDYLKINVIEKKNYIISSKLLPNLLRGTSPLRSFKH